jgi:ribosomal protein S18 acetylase RimI-like enzyme
VEGLPIRTARRGDVPSLLLLWTAMMQENGRTDPRLALHAHAREHMAGQFGVWLQDPERVIVVAEENARLVVGYAAGRVAPGTGWHQPQRIGEITDCFVVPPRRRMGIARRMVGRLTDMLYELNVDTVRVQVASSNPASLTFWKAVGWEMLEQILEWHGPEGP